MKLLPGCKTIHEHNQFIINRVGINYEDYQKTIYKLAWIYNKKTGIDFNELVCIANEEFVKIPKTFDKNKSCFNTYLIMKIKGAFSMIIQKKKEKKIDFYSDLFDNNLRDKNSDPQENTCMFSNLISELPADAKMVIDIIFNAPDDLIKMLPKKQTRGINESLLTQYLKMKNWSISKILRAFKDIKYILNFLA